MQIAVNRWLDIKKTQRIVDVGEFGPIYGTTNEFIPREEKFIQFDSAAERAYYFNSLLYIRGKADQALKLRVDQLRKFYIRQYMFAGEEYLRKAEVYKKEMRAYHKSSFFTQFFRGEPEMPTKPNLEDFEAECEKHIARDETVLACRYVLGITPHYSEFIERVMLEDYNRYKYVQDLDLDTLTVEL